MDPERQWQFLRNPLGFFDLRIAPPLVHNAEVANHLIQPPPEFNFGFDIAPLLANPNNPQRALLHMLHDRILAAMYDNQNKDEQAVEVAQATLDTMVRLLTHKVGIDVLLDDFFSSNLFGPIVDKQTFNGKMEEFADGTWKVHEARFPFQNVILGHAGFTGSDQTICFAMRYSAAQRHYMIMYLTRVGPEVERMEDWQIQQLQPVHDAEQDQDVFILQQ